MAGRQEATSFDSLKESAELELKFAAEQVTLYIIDSKVVWIDFHDPSQSHHRTSWTCVPDPDKCYLHHSNKELSTQLRELKQKLDTVSDQRRLITMNGPLVFVFGHDTCDDAKLMAHDYADMARSTFLLFLQEIDDKVKNLRMKVTVGIPIKDVTQESGEDSSVTMCKSKDKYSSFGTGPQRAHECSEGRVTGQTGGKAEKSFVAGQVHADSINHGDTFFRNNEHKGNYITNWNFCLFSNINVSEVTEDSWRHLGRKIKDSCICELIKVFRGSLIFSFAHPTRDDALDMTIKHKEVKDIILQFLRDVDPDIEDIRLKVELLEMPGLKESRQQPKHTSGKELAGRSDDMAKKPNSDEKETATMGDGKELAGRSDDLAQKPDNSDEQETAAMGDGKITPFVIHMTEDEVPMATKLTFFLQKEKWISVHLNDAMPLTESSLWLCTPTCFVDLSTKLCKALCQFDNKSRRYYNACLSKMENGNVQFAFGHDNMDDALNMGKNHEVVKDMMEDLFKQSDVEMTDVSIEIEIPPPMKSPVTGKSSQQQREELAGRSEDIDQKPDNTAEQETPAVDGGDYYEGSESSGMADLQEQSKIESGSFQVHGKMQFCTTKVTTLKDGSEIKEMLVRFYNENDDEINKNTCKTEWKCETNPDKKVLNVEPSSRVREIMYTMMNSIQRMFRAQWREIRSGSIVFVFEHESKEDALQMIKRHVEVEHLILHCLRQLDPEVEDITLHIKLQDLSQSEMKGDPKDYSPMKRKAIVSESTSTEKDETSQTSSGGSGEVLHDYSSKQKVPGIVQGLEQQIIALKEENTGLKMELAKKDKQIKDFERFQLAAKSESEALRPGPTQKSDVHAASSEGDTWKSETPTRSRKGDTATPTAARRDVQADRDLLDACSEGNLAEVKRILATGRADVNCRDVLGWTPVMWAAWWNHRDIVEVLVRHGADLTLVDRWGSNILHHACAGGDRKTVEFVLSLARVDVNARDNSGQTAADMARDCGHHQLLDLLKSRGAAK